jgi:hypothetical protein
MVCVCHEKKQVVYYFGLSDVDMVDVMEQFELWMLVWEL